MSTDRTNFLDVTIITIMNNNRFIFDWHQKLSASGRFLNFHSHHPIAHKKSIVMNFTDKIFFLSHPLFHQKNLKNIINNLINNGYHIKFIFTTITQRLKYNFCKNNSNSNIMICNKDPKMFLTVPFIVSINMTVNAIAKKFHLKLSYSIPNNLRNFIKTGKDYLDFLSHNCVVYLIPCKDCDATYVGQTKRQLNTRIKEHKSDINRNKLSLSAITRHRIESHHKFDWGNIKILDQEPSYNKRLISEMIHINRQTNGLNN